MLRASRRCRQGARSGRYGVRRVLDSPCGNGYDAFMKVLTPQAAILAILVGLGSCALVSIRSTDRILYEKDSAYNKIVVKEDERGLRSLHFGRDGGYQSIVKLGDPGHIELPYARTMLVGLAFVERPQRMLAVGLGGGTIPSFLHKHFPKAVIDVVEIDPDVVEVARKYFGFREEAGLEVHVEDGRRFIERCTRPYDLIFLDAYGEDFIPYRLATQEFLLAVRRALRPGGAVVANVWNRHSNPLHDSMLRTYQDVFSELYRFDVRRKGNKIFVALRRDGPISRESLAQRAREISRSERFHFDLSRDVEHGYHRETKGAISAPILRDKPARSGTKQATKSP